MRTLIVKGRPPLSMAIYFWKITTVHTERAHSPTLRFNTKPKGYHLLETRVVLIEAESRPIDVLRVVESDWPRFHPNSSTMRIRRMKFEANDLKVTCIEHVMQATYGRHDPVAWILPLGLQRTAMPVIWTIEKIHRGFLVIVDRSAFHDHTSARRDRMSQLRDR